MEGKAVVAHFKSVSLIRLCEHESISDSRDMQRIDLGSFRIWVWLIAFLFTASSVLSKRRTIKVHTQYCFVCFEWL
jgi:hypothetical protein